METLGVIATFSIIVTVLISGGSCQGIQEGVVDCVSGSDCDGLFNPLQLEFKSKFPFPSRPHPSFPPPTFKPPFPSRPPRPPRPSRPPRPPFLPFLGIPVQYPKDEETDAVQEEADTLIDDEPETEVEKTDAFSERKEMTDHLKKAEEIKVEENSMEEGDTPMSMLVQKSKNSSRREKAHPVPLLRMLHRFLRRRHSVKK